jgi:hypothetical protein
VGVGGGSRSRESVSRLCCAGSHEGRRADSMDQHAQSTVDYVTPWRLGRRSSRTIVKAVCQCSRGLYDEEMDGPWHSLLGRED